MTRRDWIGLPAWTPENVKECGWALEGEETLVRQLQREADEGRRRPRVPQAMGIRG
jgi:hypothetical protein